MCVDLSYLASSNRYLLRHRSQYFVDILLVLSPRITHSSLNLIDFTLPVRSALALHVLHRKEVIQPHLPIRLPCYDFTPVITPALDGQAGFGREWLPWCDGRCVQGPGTYSPQYADLRLLAIPTSRRRVAACDPN